MFLVQSCDILNLRNQVFAGNGELLLSHVSRNVDDLHSVPKRIGNGVKNIGSAQEENLGPWINDTGCGIQALALAKLFQIEK